MIRLAFFILSIGFSLVLSAQENQGGIAFQQGDFQAMLDKAKAENKLVFMDVYTTWCGPCKMLDRNTFSDAQVGSKFNEEFINYKLDAEKGEGMGISQKYGVRAYPNMLFINGQGELVHRVVGYHPPEDLLNEAATAGKLAGTLKPLSWFDENYNAKKLDKSFMKTYVGQLKAANRDNSKMLTEYFALLSASEKTAESNVKLAAENLQQLEGSAYNILASVMKESAKYARGVVQAAYSGLALAKSTTFQKAVDNKDRKLLDKLITVCKNLEGTGANTQIAEYEAQFAKATGDLSLVRKSTELKAADLVKKSKEELAKLDAQQFARYKQRLPANTDTTASQYTTIKEIMLHAATKGAAEELNSLAAGYLENMKDQADLTKALAWSARALELDRKAIYLDTQAQLLYKLGNKPEAIKLATEAVEKANSEQKEGFQESLEKMKQGK
jgi:thioredoxin-related protein